jgi:hypothetical protein
MKNKNKVPQKPIVSQDPEPADPPLEKPNEEREEKLGGWDGEVVALANARLSMPHNSTLEIVSLMHTRAVALCRIVEDMALGTSENEASLKALASVMEIVQEHINVAAWITNEEIPFSEEF